MLKKIVSLFMITILACTLVACGTDATGKADDTSSKSSQNEKSDTKEESKSKVELSHQMTFMGYDIAYVKRDGSTHTVSTCGKIVGDTEYAIIIEAPSIIGEFIEVQDINDAPELCQEFLFETLEHDCGSFFDYDSTTQEITSKEEVTYNDVNMLLVEGTFTNTKQNRVFPYSAIYLLSGDTGNLPVYLVGFPTVDGYDVSEIMDTIAKEGIKKMQQ